MIRLITSRHLKVYFNSGMKGAKNKVMPKKAHQDAGESNDFMEVTSQLREWMQAGNVMEFKAGQMLFYKGHKPYGVFVVLSGQVNLILHQKGSEAKEADESHEFSGLPVHYPYGFDLILTDSVYPCTAVADGVVKALFVSRVNLIQRIEAEQQIEV